MPISLSKTPSDDSGADGTGRRDFLFEGGHISTGYVCSAVVADVEVDMPKDRKKIRRTNRRQLKEDIAGWAFIAPVLLIFIVLTAFPFLFSLFLSFTEWNFLGGWEKLKFVGLKNFVKLIGDHRFKQALVNTFVYVVGSVPLSILLAMVLAYCLKDRIYGKRFLHMLFFIPYVCSIVAIGAVFKFLFREDGIINNVLMGIRLVSEPVKWTVDARFTKIPIILILIWTSLGYELIIYMAAIQNVPKNLYEAAGIDGAGSLSQFVNITLPMISPITFYLVIVRMIAVFKVFGSVDIFTMGTTMSSNSSVVTEIYGNAFSNYKFGYASAEAVVLFVIILLITGFNFWSQKKWVHY